MAILLVWRPFVSFLLRTHHFRACAAPPYCDREAEYSYNMNMNNMNVASTEKAARCHSRMLEALDHAFGNLAGNRSDGS